MTTRTAIIASSVGLHARPASLFVQKITRSGLPVTIARPGGKPVNAASMLAVMSLGVKCGEEVELSCDAENGDAFLDELVAFLAVDHDAKG